MIVSFVYRVTRALLSVPAVSLRRDVAKDDVVSLDDIHPGKETLIWQLWQEQNHRWPVVEETVGDVHSLSEAR